METLIIILLLIIIAEVTNVAIRLNRPVIRRTRRPMFIDTSVLIDGRIVAIARSGFISDTLMIPRSVIGELQFLADNADSEKRTRARHGLDVVTELQAMDEVSVEIFPDGSKAEEGVDERLLKLAKQHSGALCTIDFNLNKVAQVEGIAVVNVNDLAKTLRMAHLPGEKIMIALTTKGNDGTQAVGHLDDGTMVVVEQGKSKIGTVVEAEVIRSLQTAAGRMMFARLVDTDRNTSKQSKQQNAQKNTQSKQPSRGRKPAHEAVEAQIDQDAQKKPEARSRAQKARSAQTQASNSPAPETPAQTQSNRSRSVRRNKTTSPARKNNEDRLIELVNSQED